MFEVFLENSMDSCQKHRSEFSGSVLTLGWTLNPKLRVCCEDAEFTQSSGGSGLCAKAFLGALGLSALSGNPF